MLQRGAAFASCLAIGIVGLASSGCGGGGGGGSTPAGLVSLNTTAIPAARTGVIYTAQLDASFPNMPGKFLLTGGALPTGLTLDHETGVISGYPRQAGSFHFEIGARDGVDPTLPPGRDENFAEDRRDYSVTVAVGLPNILPQIPPAAQYRASYGYQIDVAGGTAPFTFAVTGGTLPDGITVDFSGFIGTFPTTFQAAPYTFQVTVTDALGKQDTETLALQVVVLPLLFFTSNPIQQAAQGFPYDLPITLSSGGGGAPYSWTQDPPVAGETLLADIGMQITPFGHLADLGLGVAAPVVPGTYLFTVRVVDEPLQVATRQFSLTVNPGPVLSNISPKTAAIPGPYTVTGLNFQPGAQVIFKPGPTQTVVAATFVSPTTLTFNSPVPKPSNGSGPVDVMVKNPDGGTHTKAGAFVFPATNLAFGTKGFFTSNLSSSGLAVADVNGDGLADIVHSGTVGQSVYSGSATSTAGGLLFHLNLGGNPPTFSTVVLDTSSVYDVKFADVNTDGKLDIVAIGQTVLKAYLGNGDGTFGAPISSTLPGPGGSAYPQQLAVGKLNSDSIPDVVFGVPHFSWLGQSNINGRIYSMSGAGNGSFVALDSNVSSMPSTYGVMGVNLVDTDGDGRAEIIAGIGMNVSTGPMFNYSATGTNGLFTGWSAKGGTVGPPYYATTYGVALGDFAGNGTQQAAVIMSGSPNYSNFQAYALFSGTALSTKTSFTSNNSMGKDCAAIDGDFDGKSELLITGATSTILVYKGATPALVFTLDAATGSPSVSAPRTGRVASGDLNGDGAPDIIATTSWWCVNGMASNYGSTYQTGQHGDGGQKGIVFYLNTSN